jgi:DNA-binding NtrC family response regulator
MGRRPTSDTAFSKVLSEEHGPLYWISPDRVIRYVNDSLAQWLKIERETIEGLKAEFQSVSTTGTAQALANALCPPQLVFDRPQSEFEIQLRQRHRAHSLALRGPNQESLGLLVTVSQGSLESNSRSLEAADLHLQIAQLRGLEWKLSSIDRFLGVSPAAKRIREQIAIATESEASTLIVGTPGSGRESIARAIVAASSSTRRLLPISCRQLDAEMLRSMVDNSAFRGSSAGAPLQVLLMLEVDQLDSAAQLALREVFKETRPPRVLSTARRSLRGLVEQGKYDAALCDCLSVLQITSPPLAERREDIPILAQAFLEQHNQGRESQLTGFAPDAMDLLLCYSWPGNVDQLIEIVREAAETATKPLIYASQLPERIRAARHAAEHPKETQVAIDLDAILRQVELELIERALTLAQGNKSKAAALLSLPRARLLRKLEQFQLLSQPASVEALEMPDFRPLSEFPNLSPPTEAD